MSVWVVAEATQLALASDVMLATSAGTVLSGYAVGAVAHRRTAQPGLSWRQAVVAAAHDAQRGMPTASLLQGRGGRELRTSAAAAATRSTGALAAAVLGVAGVTLAVASGNLPAAGPIATLAAALAALALLFAASSWRPEPVRSLLSRRGVHLAVSATFRELCITGSMAVPVLAVAHTAGVASLSVLEVLAVVMATRLVTAAVPVVGGLGVADVTLMVGLAWMGVPIPVGVAAVMIWRTASMAAWLVSTAIASRSHPMQSSWNSPARDGTGRYFHRLAFAVLGWLPAAVRDRTRGRLFDLLFTMSPDPWGYGEAPYETRKRTHLVGAVGTGHRVIVEVGCADGHNLVALAQANPTATIIGTDVSETAVRIAARRTRHLDGVHIIHASDVDGLQRAVPGPVDCIVLAEVLYYLGGQHAMRQSLQPLRQTMSHDAVVVMLHGAVDATALHERAAAALGMSLAGKVDVPDAERSFQVAVACFEKA